MDASDSVNSFVRLTEYVDLKDSTDTGLITERFQSSFGEDMEWHVVLNPDLDGPKSIADFPEEGDNLTVQSTQALIFHDGRNVGIIGVGSGEFYGEKIDEENEVVKKAFFEDLPDGIS